MAVAVGAALGAIAIAAGPAQAELVATPPLSSELSPTNLCHTILRCPVTTSIHVDDPGELEIYAEFPKGATGSVTLSVSCHGGFSRSKTASIARVVDWEVVPMTYGGCTVTQTVLSGFTTQTVKILPGPDTDGFRDTIGFVNT
jgi:hypothetical protein